MIYPEYKDYINKISWNVIRENFNTSKFEAYNVFGHYSFLEDVINVFKSSESKETFSTALVKEVRYHFWSKCEYEIVLQTWPKSDYEEKIDIAYQLFNNWDRFVDYTWESLEEYIK